MNNSALHDDAIRMKCEQLGFKNYEKYIKEILDITHSIISKKKYITEKELEELVKEFIAGKFFSNSREC